MLVYVLLLVEDGVFNHVATQRSPRDRQKMYEAREELKQRGLVDYVELEGWTITQAGQIKIAEIRLLIQ